MNPQHATTVAAGIAGTGVSASLVVIISWGCSLCRVAMPPEVAVALGSLIATGIHCLFRSAPVQATAVAPSVTTAPGS
jgi:hypothetical protein